MDYTTVLSFAACSADAVAGQDEDQDGDGAGSVGGCHQGGEGAFGGGAGGEDVVDQEDVFSGKCTADGEPAYINAGYHIDTDRVADEEQYDGFYAICTNLEEYTDRLGRKHHTIKDLLKINRARWEIEESFRIMKTQMRARPVYHRTDRAVKGHFAICFVALFLYRVLEHRLGETYTTDNILSTLRDMNALRIPSEDFIPTFKRTGLTDKLFEISGFYLDTEIIMLKRLKSILSLTKK